ncbi:MAG: MnmC family methyltransferase [Bdellovibrionales bacterium]
MIQHQLDTTEDGSPTLVTTYENGVTERMHHFRGAMAESLYIYQPAITWSFQNVPGSHVMSLGLGLGYNELITAALALRAGLESKVWMTTYEIDQTLVAPFTAWLQGQEGLWRMAYQDIETRACQHFNLPQVRETLNEWRSSGRWQVRAAFPDNLPCQDRYSAILYDAFSRKMDEHLWSQEFLTGFLAQNTTPSCALATYAATGNLKRALKQNGFLVESKTGFGGKKESTFAIRQA